MRGGFYLYDPRFSDGTKILCEGWAEREAVCHIILHSPPSPEVYARLGVGVPKQAPRLPTKPPSFFSRCWLDTPPRPLDTALTKVSQERLIDSAGFL